MCIRDSDIDERCNVILEHVSTVNDNLKSFASNSGNMTIDSEEINSEVSNTDDYNNMLKSNIVDNSGDNESRMRVEVDQGLLVSAYDLEGEYSDTLNIEYEQRATQHCYINIWHYQMHKKSRDNYL